MKRILLVDDDLALCELLAEYLTGEGLSVACAHDGEQGLRLAQAEDWDAIVLDVMLPGMNGLDVLRALRQQAAPPILMLSARGEDTDTVVGLELGADDYVSKPCSPRVLVARLRALFRRQQSGQDEHSGIHIGDLSLDPASRSVQLAGQPLSLTGAEFNLLQLLLRHAGQLVSREQLAAQGLGTPLGAYDRRIETHMAHIRRKLGPLPNGQPRILTVRGQGYQYQSH
ncbi:MAG: response regulator transcription factor [Thiohalomonadaceae bacterium]